MLRKITHQLLQAILLLAIVGAGLWLGPHARAMYARMFPPPAYESGDFSALRKQADKPVVIFTTSTCPYCKQARELLTREGVDYRDYVIDLSPQAERQFLSLNGKGVPLLFIGDRRISGFREEVIRESISLNRRSH